MWSGAKCGNHVGLEKRCQTHIYLLKSASIQPRTSPSKICNFLKKLANSYFWESDNVIPARTAVAFPEVERVGGARARATPRAVPGHGRLVVACVKWGTLYSAQDVNCLSTSGASFLMIRWRKKCVEGRRLWQSGVVSCLQMEVETPRSP